MPYLLKAEPYDPALAATRALYFSDTGFTSEPGDTPSNVHYVRRIEAPYTIRRALWSGSDIGGFSETSFGSATLANDDGALDAYADLEWGGRLVQIWYTAKERPALADFVLVFNGTAEEVTPGDELEIPLRDLQVLLDKPFSRGQFAGTGGIEGSVELTGRERPACIGRRRQIEPVLINAGLNIYMVDPLGFHALLAARDKGDAFTVPGGDVADYAALAALTMAGVDYATSRAAGLIRLTSKPEGRFTIDVEGVAPAGVWISSYADLVQHIVTSMTTLTAGDLDVAAFSAMDALQPAVLGYYAAQPSGTVRSVIDELSDSVGAYWGFNEARKLEVARFDAPAGTADFEFTERDLFALTPRPVERRLKSLRVGYRKFDAVLSDQDMVESVPDADREAFKAEFRWTDKATDAGTAAAALLATDEDLKTLFDDAADAMAERDRRLALHAPKRRAFDGEVPLTPGLTAGKTVRINDSRFGLALGRNFRVMECETDASGETNSLVLWG